MGEVNAFASPIPVFHFPVKERAIMHPISTWICLCAILAILPACGRELPPPLGGSEGVSRPDLWSGPVREAEWASVTSRYGPLRVVEGDFQAESSVKPWSSWWFPSGEKYLFEGSNGRQAPLEKYDAYVKASHSHLSRASQYERERLYDPVAAGWEGLCHAWALASLLSPEPREPVKAGGVTFGVGDLKALLVKTYERTSGIIQYGQRFNGDRDSRFDDIHPDQFHRFLQAELMDGKRPFILDKDPGLAVWNTPIWKAFVKVSSDESNTQVVHVSTWLQGASPFVDSYDYVGTLAVTFEYTYDLYGERDPDGHLRVMFGEWTGASVDYHPDFVTALPGAPPERTSRNPEVNPAFVEEILGL